MLIKEKADQIVEEFEMFDDWMDKYNYLIEMGNSLEKFDEKQKVENNLISGCQSRVWLHAEMKEGKVIFSADSDAVITKGIINLLISVLSNHTPDEIINADMNFVDQIGRAHV